MHLGLCSIEQRTEMTTDDIAAHDFIFGIAKAFIACGFHGGIDFFYGHFFVQNGGQFSQGTGKYGTRCALPSSLPFSSGRYQADGFGGAGAVGNDIVSGSPGTAQITFWMRRILCILVVRIGVNGSHEARLRYRICLPALLPSAPGNWWYRMRN